MPCGTGDVSNAELLALLGVFGAIFSAAQAGAIEHTVLRDAPWDWQVTVLYGSAKSTMCEFCKACREKVICAASAIIEIVP